MSDEQRTAVVDRVAAAIADAIAHGELPPGRELREAALARAHVTSRTTVRAAIARLIAAGMVEQPPNRSARVRVLGADDLRDLYATRRLIELEALRRLIADDGPLGPLRAVVDEIADHERRRADVRPTAVEIDADVRFHRALVAAAGSPRLLRAFDALAAETRLAFVRLAAVPAPSGEHRALLAAIVARDADRAMSLLDAHLRDGLRICLDAVPG